VCSRFCCWDWRAAAAGVVLWLAQHVIYAKRAIVPVPVMTAKRGLGFLTAASNWRMPELGVHMLLGKGAWVSSKLQPIFGGSVGGGKGWLQLNRKYQRRMPELRTHLWKGSAADYVTSAELAFLWSLRPIVFE
jgi:hypothetical protein